MSRWRGGDRRDAPALFLDWTVPLLPDSRRQWGQAMRAELAGLDTAAVRWRFAGGCALAILRRPSLGALGSLLVPVGFVVATVRLTAGTAYLPLHVVLIAMVMVLAALYLCGDRVELFVPRRTGSRVAGAVRVGGALTLGWLALGIVLSDRSGDGNVVDRATTGVPIFTVLLGLYLVGFLALTSPALADNRVLTRGVGLGVLAAVAWLATALTALPIPLSSSSAFLILGAAILTGAGLGARRGDSAITALCTALVGSLAIFVVVQLALTFGPAGWIPSDTAALTPAARLAQSRVEALESYLSLLLVGVAAAVTILVRAMNRHPWAQPAAQPSAAATVAEPIG